MPDQKTLYVFAHEGEATAFSDVEHLVTGIGKIGAAVALAGALAGGGYERVVVLGTAGVIVDGEQRPDIDTVYQVTTVIQHDFPLESAPLRPAGDVLLTERQLTMATGDVFVSDDEQRIRLAGLGAQLVDMEGYAYASVCERFNVPLQIFKIPSEFADSNTTIEDWFEVVERKSRQLRAFWDQHLDREIVPVS
ncbi:purine-nucleoside phosphorylase [Arthrobacter sp. LS16]|uniref:phosphorylase family protein n=1 Tax=Arthrobacter sp. 'calajunan' TaxID=1690248 RepID=UPI003C78D0B0